MSDTWVAISTSPSGLSLTLSHPRVPGKVTDMQYPKSADEKRLEKEQDRILRMVMHPTEVKNLMPEMALIVVLQPIYKWGITFKLGKDYIEKMYALRRDAYWHPRFGQAAEFMRIVEGGR